MSFEVGDGNENEENMVVDTSDSDFASTVVTHVSNRSSRGTGRVGVWGQTENPRSYY